MARKGLDKQTAGDLTRLLVFIVVTSLATALLVITIANVSFGATNSYKAVFSDVTGVVTGDDVRVAGVKVGTVDEIEILSGNRAQLTFSVAEGTSMTESTFARIRFRNLVGQRFLDLDQESGSAASLSPGDTIPLEQTAPALDLTVLFNGFKPLFEALSPDDINKLSFEIVQTFQGEGGTLESLLGSTASVTQTLANRDALITDLIDNLDETLTFVADRNTQLRELISSFQVLIGGLNQDREAILSTFDEISELSTETADLVRDVKDPFNEDIRQLRRLTNNINRNKPELDRALQVLPIKLNKIGRTAIYGSFFNFYLCDLRAQIKVGDLVDIPVDYSVNAERCDLG